MLTGPEVLTVAGTNKIFTKLFSVCSERSFSYSNSDRVDGLGMEGRSGEEGEEEASPDMDGCPAIKVGRAGTWEGLFWGK